MVPVSPSWSPDDRLLGFLHADEEGTRQLYTLDAATQAVKLVVDPGDGGDTEANLSLEEKLRRERQRSMAVGVTSFAWGTSDTLPDASRSVVFPLRGSALGCAVDGGAAVSPIVVVAKEASGAAGSVLDAKLSPDGRFVAFVQDGELYAVRAGGSADGAAPRQLTVGARGNDQTNGLADFIAQEEMDRYTGFWWSEDSAFLAFQRTDDRAIPPYKIVHQGTQDVIVEEHRYPFAGAANPQVSLGVVALPTSLLDASESGSAGGKGKKSSSARGTALPTDVLWLDLHCADDAAATVDPTEPTDPTQATPFAYEYLARVHWMRDGGLAVELQSRDQCTLRLVRYDVRSAMQRRALGLGVEAVEIGGGGFQPLLECRGVALLTERRDACWVNLHHMWEEVGHGHLLWGSERSGFMQLYLYEIPPLASGDAACFISAVTQGEWVVDDIKGVRMGDDASSSLADAVVFFSANAEAPLDKHLYMCPLLSATTTPAAGPVMDEESNLTAMEEDDEDALLPLCRVTVLSGTHSATLDHGCARFADTFSSAQVPPTIQLWTLPAADGAALRAHLLAGGTTGVLPPPTASTLICTLFRSRSGGSSGSYSAHSGMSLESSSGKAGYGREGSSSVAATLRAIGSAIPTRERPLIGPGSMGSSMGSGDFEPIPAVTAAAVTAVATESAKEPSSASSSSSSSSSSHRRRHRVGIATPPEFISLLSRDGSTTLYGAVYRPDIERFGAGPYPTIVATYGGPHVQFCANTWSRTTADARAQRFRGMGFLVWKLDNRGSSRRGLAFESAMRRDMGRVEVSDQEDGVRYLIEQGWCDAARVGVYGWSYGGYMALSLLFRSSMFTSAVSGAPGVCVCVCVITAAYCNVKLLLLDDGIRVVQYSHFKIPFVPPVLVTHWDGYDTHYTERYMGTPANNPSGYAASAVMTHVHLMAPAIRRAGGGSLSRLMLVSGLIDENVHWRHTGRLINALIAARKRFDVLPFPNERHSPRNPADRRYMEQRITDFFTETLHLTASTKI